MAKKRTYKPLDESEEDYFSRERHKKKERMC